MDTALTAKKQKESEAQELLNSIDEYFMQELGIEYKEAEEKKVFGIPSSQLETENLSV
ncbi:MAG: hypothetical protein ACRBG0_05045 [Lewinella sp.]|uniref:hypothetical protein n=1 Tax=Lewinella sp. TaxID=2004506 RepID=UPI003D6B70C2